MPGITSPDSAELMLFPFLLSGLFLSFLSLNLFKGGLSSFFFFLVGCHHNLDVALCQFIEETTVLRGSLEVASE